LAQSPCLLSYSGKTYTIVRNFVYLLLVQIIRKYLSLLLVVLVCIPIADKAWDEYSHLNEEHCGDVSTHYCPTEHHCEVCDYVFSSGSDVPTCAEFRPLSISASFETGPSICSIYHAPAKGIPCLRGPPEC
jgi:hypothetical protein